MGEQRPAIVADEGEDDLLDWPPPEVAVHLQSADDLTAESPDVLAGVGARFGVIAARPAGRAGTA